MVAHAGVSQARMPYTLTPLETASGLVYGLDDAVRPLHRVPMASSPRDAIERAILNALRRPPCAVSFSGGRDSSAVLALATHVARVNGLPPPIPVTLRFHDAKTHESEWQETVVRHLALGDWRRLDMDDQLDMIGPYAQRVIERDGIVWPLNAHFHLPIFEQVPGGTVLTGVGGDEIMLPGRWLRVGMLRARRAVPRTTDIGTVALAMSPRALRRRILARRERGDLPMPWLTMPAQHAVEHHLAADSAMQNVRFDVSLRNSWWRSRYRTVCAHTLRILAADHDVRVVQPLQDPQFLVALASAAGPGGFWNRTAAMTALVGDLLPEPILSRSTKARFDDAFWTRRSGEFAAAWDGEGLDGLPVDLDVLRAIWSDGTTPNPLTWLLLQTVWQRTARRGTHDGSVVSS